MMICQKLYEKGYITYMRTDAAKYSDEFIDKSKKFIIKNFGKEYINKNIDKLSNKMSNQVKAGLKKSFIIYSCPSFFPNFILSYGFLSLQKVIVRFSRN